LFGALVANQTLNLLFLLGRERPTTTFRTPTATGGDPFQTIGFVSIDNQTDGAITQSKIAGNLTPVHSALESTNHLVATLLLRVCG